MTKELNMDLFDKWSECRDRQEYIALTMQLFGVDRKKAESMADELKYKEASPAA